MCHIYFYVVTLSSLCLPSSARVSLLPRCPRSMSSAFILHLCNLYTKMCPPLGQDCPCFLCVHYLCHLCLFDISLLCLLIICHLCFNDATLSCLCLLSSLRLSLLPGCPNLCHILMQFCLCPLSLCAGVSLPPGVLILCHLCPFDVLVFASVYAFSACAIIFCSDCVFSSVFPSSARVSSICVICALLTHLFRVLCKGRVRVPKRMNFRKGS